MKLKTLAACLLFAGMAVSAMAEDATAFPEKPIQLVVPYPPGGVNDAVARIVGQQMSDDMGQSVVIVNRPGGGTVIGTETVARARSDGYTLLICHCRHHRIRIADKYPWLGSSSRRADRTRLS